MVMKAANLWKGAHRVAVDYDEKPATSYFEDYDVVFLEFPWVPYTYDL